jgi:hypothetical protein
MIRKLVVFLTLFALLSLAGAALAQDNTVIVDGLTNPRGLAYDANGALYIAEAGTGGDIEAQGPFGPVLTGSTSRVLAVAPDGGDPAVVLDGFNSTQGFSDYVGVQAVLVDNATLWLALGDGPASFTFNRAVIGLDQTSLRTHTFIDVFALEAEQNPDGEDVTSNPSDIAVTGDGLIYIIDTSGNSLLTYTAADGLQLFHVWEDLPVPTSVALDGEGNIYVGFLTAFPFPSFGAFIEKWSPDGELLETYDGLTAVTDVHVDDAGTVYAVQLADGFGDLGWNPNSGSVVTVSADGVTPLAEGLSFPYAMAFAPDGSISVTVNSSFSPAGSGQVISIPAGI